MRLYFQDYPLVGFIVATQELFSFRHLYFWLISNKWWVHEMYVQYNYRQSISTIMGFPVSLCNITKLKNDFPLPAITVFIVLIEFTSTWRISKQCVCVWREEIANYYLLLQVYSHTLIWVDSRLYSGFCISLSFSQSLSYFKNIVGHLTPRNFLSIIRLTIVPSVSFVLSMYSLYLLFPAAESFRTCKHFSVPERCDHAI